MFTIANIRLGIAILEINEKNIFDLLLIFISSLCSSKLKLFMLHFRYILK